MVARIDETVRPFLDGRDVVHPGHRRVERLKRIRLRACYGSDGHRERHRVGGNRPQYYNQQPQYYNNQPQYYGNPQPQYVESPTVVSSQPVERIISSTPVESTATPKPNVVKQAPKPNDLLKSLTGALAVADGSAADPLLAVAAQQSVEKMTEPVSAFVDEKGSDEMKAEWQAVADSGSSPEAITTWWKAWGGRVEDPAVKALGPVHVGMSKLVKDLEDGLLSSNGKKHATDKVADLVADLPAGHPSRTALAADVARMRQFQRLGELLSLAGSMPDPMVPILQGTKAMGMPVAFVAEVIGMPLRQSPVADGAALPANVSVYIVNQSTNTQSVNCSIGSRQVEMRPGATEALTGSTSVAFDPGNGKRRSVTVSAGTWGWKVENGLWNLVKVTPQVTIDNTGFKGAFHYTVNGKQATVGGGETAQHSHSLPIEITFDRGNGKETATKLLAFGTYATGIDVASRGLDLFRTDVPPGPASAAESVPTTDQATPEAGASAGKNRVREALQTAERQKELARLLQTLERPKP